MEQADAPNLPSPQPIKKSKWWLWIIIGIIILGLVAGAFLLISKTQQPIEPNNTTNNETNNKNQSPIEERGFLSEDDCSRAGESLTIINGPNTFVDSSTNIISIEIQRSSTDYELLGLEITLITENDITKKDWTEKLPQKNEKAIQVFNGTDFDYGTTQKVGVGAKIRTGNSYKICYGSNRITIPTNP